VCGYALCRRVTRSGRNQGCPCSPGSGTSACGILAALDNLYPQSFAGEVRGEMAHRKPNVLIIMTDQQRYDSLGCYGFDAIPTPNINKLAETGVLYENCYVNNPICTPSRAGFFTGKHLPGHGVYSLNDILPAEEILFPKVLQENGYETALIGKLHVSGATFEQHSRNRNDGFDHYNWNHEPALFEQSKYNCYAKWLKNENPEFFREFFSLRRQYNKVPEKFHCTTYLCNCASQFIRCRTSSQPFFCFLSFFDPHNPYGDCPQEGLDLVDESKLPVIQVTKGEMKDKPLEIQREHYHGYMGNYDDYTPAQFKEMQKGYYGSIAFIDQQLEKVFDALNEQGEMENTLIVFLSDHGDMLGDHELLAKGAFFYDPCTKVPLIIKYPGEYSLMAKRIKTLVQPHDIAATVLHAAGLWDDTCTRLFKDSHDIYPAEQLCSSYENSEAVCMYRGTGICDTMGPFDPPIYATMFRKGRYKLNLYHDLNRDLIDGELFDMEVDPGEKSNLWNNAAFRDCREKLINNYINWQLKLDLSYNAGRGGRTNTVSKILLDK
jgi:arylsulfatase A-like enzyme